ncbi:hypothetical protein C8R45DRAFT_277076 [Mycena sanguinolenta]|nr:hypothetical protein C8R45DRAFT_277076 [Mycena sanguinolenta]
MDDSVLGCAQKADGTLRDASEINWFNDRDDEQPTSGPAVSSSQLHPFFTGTAKPVGKIAGARRSARTTRPSARTDARLPHSDISLKGISNLIGSRVALAPPSTASRRSLRCGSAWRSLSSSYPVRRRGVA